MRVLHIITTLNEGGAENHLLQLTHHLKKDHTVEQDIAFLKKIPTGARTLLTEFHKIGIVPFDLKIQRRWKILCFYRLITILSRNKYDLIHTHLFRAELILSLANLFKKQKYIASVHNREKFFKSRFVNIFLKRYYEQAAGVIAISHSLKEYLIETFHLPAEKITVIPYGFKKDHALHSRLTLKEQLNLPPHSIVIGNLARLAHQKRPQDLIAAFARIRQMQQDLDLHLVFIGRDDEDLLPELKQFVARLNLSEVVHFAGHMKNGHRALSLFDIFVLPSEFEGFGLVVLEALNHKVPVIVSDVPALNEIITHNHDGLIFPLGNQEALANAIQILLSDKNLQTRLIENGDKTARRYTLEQMAQQTWSLYQSALHN